MATKNVRKTEGYKEAKASVVKLVEERDSIVPSAVNEELERYTDDQVREAIWDLIYEKKIVLDYDLGLVSPEDFDQ